MFTFPNRGREYKAISNEITAELEPYSGSELLDILDNKVKEYNLKINTVSTELQRVKYEIYIDIYKKYLEDFLEQRDVLEENEQDNELWQGYPELTDAHFNSKIYNKKEFRNHIIEKEQITFNKPKSLEFRKSATQAFISTYLSPFTPYNGLLLWHGVGVGKTCAAISSAENYRKFGKLHGKIIILVPNDTLISNWKNEIFNIDAEIANKKNVNVQCTGSSLKDELGNLNELNIEQKQRRVNKLIDKYYEFIGYRSFANSVIDDLQLILKDRIDKENKKIEYIRRKFSDRVFILDEVHNTRQYANSDDSKAITMILEMIARYGNNNKLILASATPMYNSSEEIISIINLLLLNDKRSPIEIFDIFENDGFTLKPNAPDLLEKKTRGYISFLRGENPLVFPVKIYPNLEGLSYLPNPKYYYLRGQLTELPENLKIKHLSFIKNEMSQFQYKYYKKTVAALTDDDEIISDKFSIPSTVSSNIIFPIDQNEKGELIGKHGDEGFKECIEEQSADKENKSNIKYKYNDIARMDNGMPFLHESNLATFSIKFFNILQIIKNAEGIAFVYSKYLLPGVISLALMFEQNGYKRYSPGDVNINMLNERGIPERCYCGKLKSEHIAKKDQPEYHEFKQGTYILFTGESKGPEVKQLVNEVRHSRNKDGSIIKIILGTNRVEVGLNFFNIREVHIVDPWHHFNKIEQVVGRAMRKESHKNLPSNKRNVSVYLHCATIPQENSLDDKKNIETSDEKTYRNAYIKSKRIAEVTRILKRNAVDCLLNKNGNQLTIEYFGNTENRILTSQKIQLFNVFYGDINGDVICDYMDCKYDCVDEDIKTISVKPNTDTYNDILSLEDISEAKNLISILFQIKDAYTAEEIINIKNKNFERITDNFIFQSLNNYIYFDEPIYDKYHREGHLIYRDTYYIFQPYELDDNNSSFTTRVIPLNYRALNYAISDIDNTLTKVSNKSFKIDGGNEEILEDVSENKKKFIDAFRLYISKVKSYIHSDKIYGKLGIPSKSSFRLHKRHVECPVEEIQNIQDSTCPLPKNTILDLLEQYLIFSIIDRLSFDNKKIIISHVLETNIAKGGFCLMDDLLETMVLRMYEKKCEEDRRYSIFRARRDLYGPTFKGPDLPIVFRIVDPTDGMPVYFVYNENTLHFEEADPMTAREYAERPITSINYDYLQIKDTDLVYGFVQDKEKRANVKKSAEDDIGIDPFHVEFYLINKRFHKHKNNKDDTVQHKSEIKGAVCGTALGAKDKPELIEILKYILEIDGAPLENDEVFKSEFEKKQKVNNHTDPNDLLRIDRDLETYEFLTEKGSLCELIELVLRHKQYIQPMHHWFYNYDEWCFLRHTKRRLEDQQKKQQEEQKKSSKKKGKK
jgi:hypothetical protein